MLTCFRLPERLELGEAPQKITADRRGDPSCRSREFGSLSNRRRAGVRWRAPPGGQSRPPGGLQCEPHVETQHDRMWLPASESVTIDKNRPARRPAPPHGHLKRLMATSKASMNKPPNASRQELDARCGRSGHFSALTAHYHQRNDRPTTGGVRGNESDVASSRL